MAGSSETAATSRLQASRQDTIRAGMVLGAILIAAVGLRVALYKGYASSDDGWYWLLAKQALHGTLLVGGDPVLSQSHFAVRSGLIYPTALAVKSLGETEAALAVYPFFCSLAQVVLAFLIGRLVAGTGAGLLAALLYAMLPIDISAATVCSPDLPMALCLSAALLIIQMSLHREGSGHGNLLMFLAGLILGLAWLTKEMAVYPIIACGIAVLLAKPNRRGVMDAAYLAGGCVVVVAAESLVFFTTTNDALFKYHVVEKNIADWPDYFFMEGARYGYRKGHYWEDLGRRLLLQGPQFLLLNPELLVTTIWALLFALSHLRSRNTPQNRFLSWWLIAYLMTYNFMTSSFKSYQPFLVAPIFFRYLAPLSLPSVVLASACAHSLARMAFGCYDGRCKWLHCGLGTVCLLAFCSIVTYSVVDRYSMMREIGPNIRPVREVSKMLRPSDVLYTDTRSKGALEFFWGKEVAKNIRHLDTKNLASVPAGAYVYADYGWLGQQEISIMREIEKLPPVNWERIWAQPAAGHLYRIRPVSAVGISGSGANSNQAGQTARR